MSSERDLISSIEDELTNVSASVQRMASACAQLNSLSGDHPTSSPTASAESPGGGAAQQTGGLTEAQWMRLLDTIDEWSQGERAMADDTSGMWARLQAWRSSLDSDVCATGGSASPLPHSAPPPADAHGESCVPTSPLGLSVRIPIATCTAWKEALRTAAEHLCGTLVGLRPPVSPETFSSAAEAIYRIQGVADQLPTLT